MQLKEGDNFIRNSKYGYVIGVVKSIFETKSNHLEKGILISDLKIISTTGVMYDYNECRKIIKFYSEEETQKIKALYDKLIEAKSLREVKQNYAINKQINDIKNESPSKK